jgi:hypothetical protein
MGRLPVSEGIITQKPGLGDAGEGKAGCIAKGGDDF